MPLKLGTLLAPFALLLSAAPCGAVGEADGWSPMIASLSAPRGRDGIAMRAGEPLSIELREPVAAIALSIHDPRGDSIFEVRWFRGDWALGSRRFAPADIALPDVLPMAGDTLFVSAPEPFDRIELHEIHGRAIGDPETVTGFEVLAAKGESDPNTEALACQLPLGIAHNFAFGFALIPTGLGTELLAAGTVYATNLALKFCKPWIEAPRDVVIAAPPPGECSVAVPQEHVQSAYENALGARLTYETDWGFLRQPRVFHHNTGLDVNLLGLGIPAPPDATRASVGAILSESFATQAIYAACKEDGSVATSSVAGDNREFLCPYVEGRELAIPVGDNTLVWRANVRVTPIDLLGILTVLIPGIPPGSKLEPYASILKNVIVESILIGIDANLLKGIRFGNFRDAIQTVSVQDLVPPTVTPRPASQSRIEARLVGGEIHVTIEADEPGGVSRRNYERFLSDMYDVSDACDRFTTFAPGYPDPALRAFWPVSTTVENNAFFIIWTAADPGPNASGDPNEVTARMRVEVVDIRPPAILAPPDIVEVGTSEVTELGQPLVFDFVDLDPVITNDATLPLGPGLTTVTWTATDASGNSATATQLVNVKSSNQDPSAVAQAGADRARAVSFEPTTLRLEGSDPDGDPLRFYVDDYPEEGFFVAPLYPYFVEDYRVAASSPEDSSVETLQAVCTNGEGSPTKRIELAFPFEPTYFTANDAGRSYVVDMGSVKCDPLRRDGFKREQRIARFGPAGELEVALPVGENEFRDLVVDERNGVIVSTQNLGGLSRAGVETYDLDLNSLEFYRLENMRERLPDGSQGGCGSFGTNGFCEIRDAVSAVVDRNGVLYVMERTGRIYALDAFREESEAVLFIDYLSDDVTSSASTFVPADSLALDSEGFVYASRNNRLYKYTPSWVDENGLAWPGEPVGWLGRCDTDLAAGDEAVCDTFSQRSLGYSCTDATCGVELDIPQNERDFCDYTFSNDGNFGCRPGQFRSPRGIDIDDRDTLYVADAGNQRIQRFTVDGFFAGEAESECDGSCFVLGDFGSPQDVSVNSSRFYILDTQTDLLHVSLLTPFKDQGPDFAELVYQSNNDFACTLSADCVDRFGFSVSDGVRDPDTGEPMRSAPATVEVEVARNFRPPVATPGIAAVVLEDVETPIVLDGAELDPLDTLSFRLATPPDHGTVLIVDDEARYVSDPDYVGPDEFAFAAFDGLDESAAEVVAVTVLNVNDAPIVSPIDDASVIRGFNFRLDGDFRDPDTASGLVDRHRLDIDWGDGTIEPEGSLDMTGLPNGPILNESGTGVGSITAEHVYTAAGRYTLSVCVTDQVADSAAKPPTATSLVGCGQAIVTVNDGVDLVLSAEASNDTVVPGQFLSYEVTVENRLPDTGAGRSASGVVLALNLDRALDPASITTSGLACERDGFELSCIVGTLAPGGERSVTITASVPFDAEVGSLLRLQADATLDQQDATPENRLALVTPLLRPADYTVGTSGDARDDVGDATPGDGRCASAAGVCTLRAAIEEANASAGQQTIALPNGVFSLTGGPLPRLTESVILLGSGARNTIIDGLEENLLSTESGIPLRLEDLTVANGNVAVRANGDLTVRRVRFTNNQATNFFGGAILAEAALDLADVTFDGNETNNDGAAVFSFGDRSTLVNVTVTGGVGGGLAFTTGNHELTHVTIVGNESGGGWSDVAGALSVYGDATVTLTNSILARNIVGPFGNGPNCGVEGTLVSGGGNLFGDLDQCPVAFERRDRQVPDPKLGPTAIRKRGLPTRDPLLESLAVDRALSSACVAADAVGTPRPVDGDGDGVAACDIGAAELLPDRVFADGFER
ncbi:MAG: Ig-like domain-containing protein [Pseudomonadota bacterium]